jgi:hypothetical protein
MIISMKKGGGVQLKTQYSDAGFQMLKEHATFAEGGNSVESGLIELRDLMLEGDFGYSTRVNLSSKSSPLPPR